ncbi:MAG: hypothetical protein IPI67_37555 [Myxococcales bacterium]|nr:hypothetical protein [Myxococcales bacterium]
MSSQFALAPAPALVLFGIPALAVAMAVLFVLGVRHAAQLGGATPAVTRRQVGLASLGVATWMALTAAAALSGQLQRFDLRPPPMVVMLLLILGGGVALGLSRVGKLFATLPLWLLVGAQGLRFPLELVMHEAARSGVMPVQMSFSGYNFDIVTGAGALFLAAFLKRGDVPRAVVVFWNVLGLCALSVIAVVALATSPMLRAFGDGSLNTWVLFFPYVWLPAVMVTAAVAGHVVVFRHLAQRRSAPAPALKDFAG